MKHKTIIFIVIAVLIIVLSVVWIKTQTRVGIIPQPEAAQEIADPAVKALSADSVILGTDKDVYSPGDNITAYVLIKNDFESEKNWQLIAGVKDPGDASGARLVAFQSQAVNLSPGEISRQNLDIGALDKKLKPGNYSLELSVRENNQEISLKTITFEIKQE